MGDLRRDGGRRRRGRSPRSLLAVPAVRRRAHGSPRRRRRGSGARRPACSRGGGHAELLAQILWFFTKAGAFVFGSGLAIVPFLYGGVVQEYGWLNDKQFLDAVAVAMLTPGPDRHHRGVHRLPGGGSSRARVAAAVGVFLPVYLFVVIPFPGSIGSAATPKVKAFVGRRHGGGLGHHRRRLLRARPARHRRRAHPADRRHRAGDRLALQGPGARAHRRRRGGGPHHLLAAIGETIMKWITRERARVDRIACPWLITRFIDPTPEFLFVPAREVRGRGRARAARSRTTFRTWSWATTAGSAPSTPSSTRYELADPGLATLAAIVRGADTDDRALTPESAGLYAAATGSRRSAATTSTTWPASSRCTTRCTNTPGCRPPRRPCARACSSCACTARPRASSAAAHFRRLAAARGLAMDAVAAGTEPDAELAPGAVKGLAGDGLTAAPARPRPVTLYDLTAPTRIVSFGCDVTPAERPAGRSVGRPGGERRLRRGPRDASSRMSSAWSGSSRGAR